MNRKMNPMYGEDYLEGSLIDAVGPYGDEGVAIEELLSVSPGTEESSVRKTINTMNVKDVMSLESDGNDTMVSLTSSGRSVYNRRRGITDL